MIEQSNEASPVRILVVDDEETIVEFLEMGLRYEGYEVHAARDGEAALKVAKQLRPDLVILDWMLPERDGLEVCRWLRAQSDVPILMLTARGDLDDKVAGLDSGADDYLPKPFKFKELLARVRALLRRRHVTVQRVIQVADVQLNRDTREVARGDRPVELTPKEFEILELLLSHPRQVFPRETIMNRVWGYDYIGDTNVIEVHISSLRDKIGDHDRQLIRTVRGVGYTLRG